MSVAISAGRFKIGLKYIRDLERLVQTMIIRDETPLDIDAITEITVAAFADCPYGNHTEQFIIHALRAAGDLSVSLAAEIDGRVVGHIAFSPVTIDG